MKEGQWWKGRIGWKNEGVRKGERRKGRKMEGKKDGRERRRRRI